MGTEFQLPKKSGIKYPKRQTICLGEDVFWILETLRSKCGAHVPELIRNALNEYFERHGLKKLALQAEEPENKEKH
jgi:hypothetical protein